MATKQKYLSAKWKPGTKSGRHRGITGVIIIDIINNDHEMPLVCCAVKKIPAYQKVNYGDKFLRKQPSFPLPFKKGIEK